MHAIESAVITYPAPQGALANTDFQVRVRAEGGEWQELFVYEVRVDMHDVRLSSVAAFDFAGRAEVEVTARHVHVQGVEIRPKSLRIAPRTDGDRIVFTLDRPCKISIEVNGDRFRNLQLFANAPERDVPSAEAPHTVYVEPGDHRPEDLLQRLAERSQGLSVPQVLYFAPGYHLIEGGVLPIPSHTTVYIAGGAMVASSMLCRQVEHVTIRGRGIIYLRDYEKTTYLRSVEIDFSRYIAVEGVISMDPPHYSIHLGQSEHVDIRNFKSFSTRGWCDGIDMMSCRHIAIDDVFLRTSDDCIAIYGSRGEFKGGTSDVTVTNAVLWADVAHPIMIGVHGDHAGDGDVIEDVRFDGVDILEHHEPQDGYWGCMAINAGDKNTVRRVAFRDIRIEPFELGRLIDIRVFHNPKYNPAPGNRVEHISFDHISFTGECENPSVIEGYDETRVVDGVTFRNVRINGRHIEGPEDGNMMIGRHAHRITFL